MRLSFRGVLVLLAGLALASAGAAQTSPAKPSARPATPSKRYCQPQGGFCFSYQANWTVVGESIGDGIVVAPPQKGARALWNVVTVALIVAPASEGQTAPALDEVIATAMGNMQKDGRNPQTLQRQERTVGDLPAQGIKVRYHDDEGHDWVESLVFVQGPQQEIYSIGLKAQPTDVERLEPAFSNIVRSWKLQSQSAPPLPKTPPNPVESNPKH